MPEIILYSFVFVGTYLGVRYFRFWSLKKNLLDVPNDRSSHTAPTPRGGGLIIVLASLSAYILYNKITGRDFSGSYVFGAFIIALVSWLDDLFTISFIWRFLIQSLSAILIITAFGAFYRDLRSIRRQFQFEHFRFNRNLYLDCLVDERV